MGMPPGFRFSPTDEELSVHYLLNKAHGKSFPQGVIAEVDIYKFEPWDLPEKSALPSRDPVWYFFNAQEKKHSHTARINRTTSKGYWKATGKDRKVYSGPYTVGVKKTLIYYEGRAPNGKRTDWIMHEYRLDEESEKKGNIVSATVLCRLRKKGGPGPRNGEQYGAPIMYENDEMEAPSSWGDLADDVDEKPLELFTSREGPQVFSLPDRSEVLKLPGQTVLSEMSSEGSGTDEFLNMERLGADCELDLDAFLQSFISDTTQVASLESGMASTISDQEQGTIQQHQLNGDIPSSLDSLPVLPSLLDLDGNSLHDGLHPDFEEAGILGEMLHVIASGQGDVNNMQWNERMISQASAYNCDGLFTSDDGVMAGDFFELDDLLSPLDGFGLTLPVQSVEFGRCEEQQEQLTISNGVGTSGNMPDVLLTQGWAPRRVRLQIPASGGNVMNADMLQQPKAVHSVLPEEQRRVGGFSNDLGIWIAGDASNNGGRIFTDSSSDSGLNPGDTVHTVNSSTSSFLSKHMSFYTVTKCEEAPPQLYYAALTDSQDEEDPITNDGSMYSTVLVNESKVEKVALEEGSFIPEASSGLLTSSTTSCTQEASPDCEAACCDPSACVESETEHPNTTRLRSNFWKTAFRGLVNRAKATSLGSRLIQLEGRLRTRFNDKVFALGKPAARFFPAKYYVNPYNSLRRGVMVSLLQLAAAVMILFCLFLGFHTLTKYAVTLLV